MECEMKAARSVLWIAAIPISLLTACSYIDGQCWPASEDGQGGGTGGPIVPAGAGGFGDVPPKPQEASDPPPPDCNIVEDTPCNKKCLTDYEDEAANCAKIQNEAQRTTCQEGAYTRYKGCRENCQQQSDHKEKCKQRCDKTYDKCMDGCKDHKCRDQCFKDYQECLMDCEKG
jgi:hypothetical protein